MLSDSFSIKKVVTSIAFLIVTTAPGLLNLLCPKEVAGMAKEAKAEAQYIMDTGDLSHVPQMDNALDRVVISPEELARLRPMISDIDAQLGLETAPPRKTAQ